MSLRTRLLLGVLLAFAPLAGLLALSFPSAAPLGLVALASAVALAGVWIVLEVVVVRGGGPGSARAPEIAERTEGFRQLVEHLPSVFWLADPATSEVLYVSPAVERIWGHPPDHFLGAPAVWMDSIHPDDRDETCRRFENKAQGTSVEGVYRILRPDGEVRWIRDRFVPVRDTSGALVRVAGIANDVTRERRLADELRQSHKIEAVGRLAGGVAHDFNNIVTAIMGHAELLQLELPEGSPLHREVDEVLRASRRAARLTGQLLAFSRKQVTRPRRLKLNALIRELAPMLHGVAGDEIALELELAPEVAPIMADPSHLEQVLVNLVSNARDALPRGGEVRVSTRMRTVTEADVLSYLPVLVPGCYVALEVRDTGPGIPDRIMDHIFEPFFTTKEVGKGTGLGLATVYGIVKKAGGFVFATNSPGSGACFEVLLPPAPVGPTQERVSGG